MGNFVANTPPDTLYLSSFEFAYKQTKRTTPTLRFYSPASATVGFVKAQISRQGNPAAAPGGSPNTNPFNSAIGNWAVNPFTANAYLTCVSTTPAQILVTTPTNGDEPVIFYHYEADARLGL
jgi:hypothetical protein